MNVYLYYLITACQMAWFTESVWYFYFRQFSDYTTMGLVFAVLNVFWIAFELPTGVIADKLGRKFSTIIGTGLVTLGLILTGLATSFWYWVIGLLIQNLGRSFISGALEALVYDDLKRRNKENSYPRIAATKSRIVIAVYAIAVIAGGFLGHINLRLPYLIFATVSFISTLAAFFLSESTTIRQLTRAESVINTTLKGLKQFRLPSLRPFLLLSWLLLFIYFVFDWGMAKPAMAVKFGFFEREQGIIYAVTSVLVIITLKYLPHLRKLIGDYAGLYVFNLGLIAMFILGIFPLGILGFIPIMMIETIGSFIEPWISSIMNQHIDSRYRATTLSALQMFGRLPYLIINPIVGNFIDTGRTNYIFIMLAAIIALVLIFNRSLRLRT